MTVGAEPAVGGNLIEWLRLVGATQPTNSSTAAVSAVSRCDARVNIARAGCFFYVQLRCSLRCWDDLEAVEIVVGVGFASISYASSALATTGRSTIRPAHRRLPASSPSVFCHRRDPSDHGPGGAC